MGEVVTNCKCKRCRSACEIKPGGFMPYEITNIERVMNKPWNKMLGKELAIDFYRDGHRTVLYLAPNIVGNKKSKYPEEPRGRCVFLKDNKCTIYRVRPFECRQYKHGQTKKQAIARLRRMVKAWVKSYLLKTYYKKSSIVEAWIRGRNLYTKTDDGTVMKYTNIKITQWFHPKYALSGIAEVQEIQLNDKA